MKVVLVFTVQLEGSIMSPFRFPKKSSTKKKRVRIMQKCTREEHPNGSKKTIKQTDLEIDKEDIIQGARAIISIILAFVGLIFAISSYFCGSLAGFILGLIFLAAALGNWFFIEKIVKQLMLH